MTRKDFQLIADVIKAEYTHPASGAQVQNTCERIAVAFAEKLKSTNPMFNKARFLQACGVEE